MMNTLNYESYPNYEIICVIISHTKASRNECHLECIRGKAKTKGGGAHITASAEPKAVTLIRSLLANVSGNAGQFSYLPTRGCVKRWLFWTPLPVRGRHAIHWKCAEKYDQALSYPHRLEHSSVCKTGRCVRDNVCL